jgi:hypothetical protein
LENAALQRPGSLLDSAAATTAAALGSMARPTDPIQDSKKTDREIDKTSITDGANEGVAAQPPSEPIDSIRAGSAGQNLETDR